MPNTTKRFKFDTKYSGYDEEKADEIDGLIHQDDLEQILDKFREAHAKKPEIFQRYRMPIVTVYYEREGKGVYEHFCSDNCIGMFCDRATELQKQIESGEIKNIHAFWTQLEINLREIKSPLENTRLD